MSEAVQPPPLPPPAATGTTTSGHEFGPADSKLIGNLASYLGSVGIVAIILGALCLVFGLVTLNPFCLVQSLLYLCMGSWSGKAASAFRNVVTTEGQDVPHLMAALGQLKNIFALFYYVIIITIVLTLAVLAMVAVIGFTRHSVEPTI